MSRKRGLVSAIIPTYNSAAFLTDAIRSVLTQEYKNIECLVIDDGSTDETHSVVEEFGTSVSYVRKRNGGVSSARNVGLELAQGEFVAFLDADDAWLPHKINRQISMLAVNPDLGMVYSAMYRVDRHLNILQMMPSPSGDEALVNTLLLSQPSMFVSQTSLLPIEIAHDVGGFSEELSTGADMEFACRIALTHRVDGLKAPLALYRQHPGQMHLDPVAMERDMLAILNKLYRGELVLPKSISRLEKRARARLYLTLALDHRKRLSVGGFLGDMTKSVAHDPLVLLEAVFRRYRSSDPIEEADANYL